MEIATGHGRWSKYLIEMSKKYIGIDLCPICIKHCKFKFWGVHKAKFFVNDGCSLCKVKNNSVDFCFSFDSLVHADRDAMDAYIKELSKKLKEDSYAFIHHSNFLQYSQELDFNKSNFHCRSREIDYLYIQNICKKYNLHVVSQELIRWMQNPYYIDCISVIYKNSKTDSIETDVFKSKYYDFTQEYGRILAEKYNFKNENDFKKLDKKSLKYRLFTISPQKIRNFMLKYLKIFI